MRAIIALSLTLMVGCGSAPFTAGDPTSSDPTGAEMSPGMTPSPSNNASDGGTASNPDSGTTAPTMGVDAGPSATIDANPPTGGDAGATTPDSGAPSPDSGAEVDAGTDTGVMVVDSGTDAVSCHHAYNGPNLGQGEGCPLTELSCVEVCNGVPGLPFCTSDCLTR